MFALPIFPGRPSIVMPSATVRGSVAGIKRTDCHTSDIGHWFAMTSDYGGQKKSQAFAWLVVFALPIFPGSRPPSIVGASELNFCVRDGNRWTLSAINTNYINGF